MEKGGRLGGSVSFGNVIGLTASLRLLCFDIEEQKGQGVEKCEF